MKESSDTSGTNRFRTIYIEEAARGEPVTLDMLGRFPDVPHVYIRNYKDVFNRPRQDMRWQASHPGLILALQPGPFVLPGPEVCQSFGAEAFFYSSLLLNCPFDCEYCFLQGMYPSKYTVAFVNTGDFVRAIREEAARHASMLLALSYDTDLPAFENIFPYVRLLSEALRDLPGLTIEFRTKSAVTSIYKEIPPSDNPVFAFSLSPREIAERFEHGAPGTEARLKAAEAAIAAGHRIRLCFDPVFVGEIDDRVYTDFYAEVFSRLPVDRVRDISHGFFRMNRDFFRKIAKARPDSRLFAADYEVSGDVLSFSQKDTSAIREKHLTTLARYLPKEKIFIV
ncbi:MAG: DNA photolyase [Oscillospiraceae bacterium]|nr:DNA photolyase [Oscillospiraceae bacterium]